MLKAKPKGSHTLAPYPVAWMLSLLSRAMAAIGAEEEQKPKPKRKGKRDSDSCERDRKLAPRINGRPARLVPKL